MRISSLIWNGKGLAHIRSLIPLSEFRAAKSSSPSTSLRSISLPVMLTDNGGEFSDVFAFENNLEGEKEACLFFCDPMQSCQKAQIEKNHTLFRDIVPKGSSFDHFTQDTVNLIFLTSTASVATFTAASLPMRCLRSLFPRNWLLFWVSRMLRRKMSCSLLGF